ncbi:MAG: ABC transporter substrate-binding protein [Propionibacteriaceae bacterium]|nr:ABC transporter substrate-binding protein [Propionibacteriaceae bacterium]
MAKVPRFIAVLLGLLLVSSGCTATAPTQESPTLTVGATLEPPTLNPFENTAASIAQVLLYNVYETLAKVDSNGELQPLLAKSWDVSDDRTQYTFHLDENAKFPSGKAVDADAIVANVDRLLSDDKLSGTLKTQLAVIDSAKRIDDTTVEIKLKTPSVMWLYDMTSQLGMIIDPSASVDLSKESAGSGPYKVKQYNKDKTIILERNQGYWGSAPKFDEVVFRYFDDPNAMNTAMLAGDLDVISNLQAPDALAQFQSDPQFSTIVGTTNGEVVLGLNHDNKALAKKEVREALTMAIDRKALMDTVWNGQGTLIGTMTVPTDPWYEDLANHTPYDPDKAKELLAKAGESDLKLRFRVPVVPYAVKSAQFVASSLRDIGVDAEVEELEFSRWITEVLTDGNYDMTVVSHVEARDFGKFADKDYYWHYADPAFVKLYKEADQSAPDQATEKFKEAARLLADDYAAIWLWALPNLVVTKADIHGVSPNMATLSFDITGIERS